MDDVKQLYIKEILKLEDIINENKILLKQTKQKKLIKCIIKMLTEEVNTYKNKYYQLITNDVHKGEYYE